MAASTEDLHEAPGRGRTMEEAATGRSLTIGRNIRRRVWHRRRKCPHWNQKSSRRGHKAVASVEVEAAPEAVVVDCVETDICRK